MSTVGAHSAPSTIDRPPYDLRDYCPGRQSGPNLELSRSATESAVAFRFTLSFGIGVNITPPTVAPAPARRVLSSDDAPYYWRST